MKAAIYSILFAVPHLVCVANQEKPNVVFIMADDLGYGDLGCYGAILIKTPNIDQLAKEGKLFTGAHSASSVSTPSRYSFITGRYPFRGNMSGSNESGLWRPLSLNCPLIIEDGLLTIGEMMQKQGYRTACIGKWHLGFTNEITDWNKELSPGPLESGFEYYFGVPFVTSAPPYVFVENHHVYGYEPNDPFVLETDISKVTDTQIYPNKSRNRYSGAKKPHSLYKDNEMAITLVDKTKKWLDKNKDNPFFLYIATPHIHHPFSPNKQFEGSSECGFYGDFVQEFDWMVGEVVNYLDKHHLSDNTIIVVTSDNGGMLNLAAQAAWEAGHRINANLLGFKFDIWEGGHRVPYIIKWPNHVQPSSTSDQLVSNIDMFATLASLTGYKLSENDAVDSYNVLDAWLGDPQQMIRDCFVMSSNSSEHMSIRMKDWVYIPNQGGGGWNNAKWGISNIIGGASAVSLTKKVNSDIVDGKIRKDAPKCQLYNLSEDKYQSVNVIRQNSGIAEELRKALEKVKRSNRTRPL